jgi:hypothetical protein
MIHAGGDRLTAETHKIATRRGMREKHLQNAADCSNNLTAEPRRLSLDDGLAGKTQKADGTLPVRRRSLIHERQEHQPLNLNPKTADREGWNIYHCTIDFQKAFQLYQT